MDNIEKVNDFLNGIKMPLFGERDSLQEALDYSYSIAQATNSAPHVMTAVHVVMNTISNEIKKLIEESKPKVPEDDVVYFTFISKLRPKDSRKTDLERIVEGWCGF